MAKFTKSEASALFSRGNNEGDGAWAVIVPMHPALRRTCDAAPERAVVTLIGDRVVIVLPADVRPESEVLQQYLEAIAERTP